MTSARTRDGRFSPKYGFATSTTAKLVMGWKPYYHNHRKHTIHAHLSHTSPSGKFTVTLWSNPKELQQLRHHSDYTNVFSSLEGVLISGPVIKPGKRSLQAGTRLVLYCPGEVDICVCLCVWLLYTLFSRAAPIPVSVLVSGQYHHFQWYQNWPNMLYKYQVLTLLLILVMVCETARMIYNINIVQFS